MKPVKAKPVHYVNNKDMLNELIKYQETKIVSEELGLMFLNIAQRYASRPNFYSYTYKEDMICDALSRMMGQVHKFDPLHPNANAFSYFTMIVHHQFLQTLKKEKRVAETKKLYRDKVWEDLCIDENLERPPELDES